MSELRRLPQSKGKIERWHKSLKGKCIRPGMPLSLYDALCGIGIRGHLRQRPSAVAMGYITPKDMLARCRQKIHAERDWKVGRRPILFLSLYRSLSSRGI